MMIRDVKNRKQPLTMTEALIVTSVLLVLAALVSGVLMRKTTSGGIPPRLSPTSAGKKVRYFSIFT